MEESREEERITRSPSRKRQRVSFSEAELLESFKKFDSDGSGTITADEFAAVVVALDIDVSDTEARRLFSWLDPQFVGHIAFPEFKEAMQRNMFFRMVVTGTQTTTDFAVDDNHDWDQPTFSAFKHPDYIVENEYGTGNHKEYDQEKHGELCGIYSDVRRR